MPPRGPRRAYPPPPLTPSTHPPCSSANPKERTDFVFGMGLSFGFLPKVHFGVYC